MHKAPEVPRPSRPKTLPPKMSAPKMPPKMLEDRETRAAHRRGEATNQDVGDTADRITRAPQKKR